MQTPRPQPSEPAAPPGAAWRVRGAPLAAAVLLALPLAFVCLRCGLSNDVPFLVQSSAAPWIAAPEPVAGTLRQWGREDVPKSVFRRSFELREKRASAWLRVRALRAFRVSVNGAPAPGGGSDGSRWRDPLELDVASLLTAGRNEVVVEVENPIGPALLSLRLDGSEPPITTDTQWRVALDGGAPALAVIADDTRRSPEALAVETPAEALRERWVAVALLFAAGAAISLVFRRFSEPALVQRLPAAALVAGFAAWGWLFARKLVHLPVTIGFDAKSHLFYVDWLATHRSVPLATDGWSTFHPPLFYALGAAVGGAGAESSEASALALKAVVFAAGLLCLVATALLAHRLLPEDPAGRALAILFAAVLPVSLYSSAYVTNESLHTLLVSLALLASVDVLLAQRPQLGRLFLLGALFGLAALTKFTGLVLIPVVFLFVAIKLWRADGHPPLRVALRLLVALAPLLAIAGWFYLRNWQAFGDPLMANWGRMPGAGHSWWQQPGFHTSAYFARFGEALVHPYMAGFTSFWDSTYSTLWGDGFIGGRVYPPDRHGLWSYDFMSIGYWLALPASALVLFGAWRGARLALRDRDAGRRAAFGLLAAAAWVLGLAYLYLVLRMAFFAQAKATYLLPLLTPLALWFALGFRALDLRLAPLPLARAALHGWLAAFAAVLYLGFAA
jgi:4-amino-4-deoxy-L-arabinose transferase-like glycosyltransferase